jgi:signal peptidase I
VSGVAPGWGVADVAGGAPPPPPPPPPGWRSEEADGRVSVTTRGEGRHADDPRPAQPPRPRRAALRRHTLRLAVTPPGGPAATASRAVTRRRRHSSSRPGPASRCVYLAGMRRKIAAVLAVAGLGWLAASAHGQTGGSTVRTLEVPSETMVPTIPVGGTVEADYAAYDHARPAIGDIVIAHPPRTAERSYRTPMGACGDRRRRPGQMCARPREGLARVSFVKRVVGRPGDRLSLRHGTLYRNGRAVKEPYTAACTSHCHFPRTITIPPHHYFLLGDNRPASFDSRWWGPVPRRALLARVEKCTPQPAVGC